MSEHRQVGGAWGPVTAEWHDAHPWISTAGMVGPGVTQLVVSGTIGVGHALRAALVIGMEAARMAGRSSDGYRRWVHSFRYVGRGGLERHFAYCASCGVDWRGTAGDLVRVGPVGCPSCGAPPSDASCERWHNWGGCLKCPGAAAVEVSGARPGPRRSAAAAAGSGPGRAVLHNADSKITSDFGGLTSDVTSVDSPDKTRPEDGPAPKAGPSASSLGSAGGAA